MVKKNHNMSSEFSLFVVVCFNTFVAVPDGIEVDEDIAAIETENRDPRGQGVYWHDQEYPHNPSLLIRDSVVL